LIFLDLSSKVIGSRNVAKIESVIDLIRSDIKHNVDVRVPKTDNLTQAERSAFRDIQERDDIIIKPADKGSAVVLERLTTTLYFLLCPRWNQLDFWV
jgi:hypothetical protein